LRTTTLFLSLFMSAGCLQADILYNNFLTTSPSYDLGNGLFIANPSNQLGLAFSFQAPAYDTYLTSINMAVTFISGESTIEVGVAADNGGVPGAILELQTLNLQAIPDGDTGHFLSEIVTFTPNVTDLFYKNQTYWVIAEGDGFSQLRWDYNLLDGGVNGNRAQLDLNGTIWTPSAYTQGAFEVQGNLVPEPGTAILLSSGLIFAGFAARRRRLNN
jgi:hypothetical protein